MMLDPSEVENIAHLARLSIDAADRDSYARNLSAILAFVEQLNSIDTSGVLPMAHPLDVHQPLRDDQVTETDIRDQVQSLAPAAEDGCYLVPRVIE